MIPRKAYSTCLKFVEGCYPLRKDSTSSSRSNPLFRFTLALKANAH